MAEKKDIGKAFRERLKDFEKSPSKTNWSDIEFALDKGKPTNPVFWQRLIGSSIVLLLILAPLTYTYLIKTEKPIPVVLETNNEIENCEDLVQQKDQNIIPEEISKNSGITSISIKENQKIDTSVKENNEPNISKTKDLIKQNPKKYSSNNQSEIERTKIASLQNNKANHNSKDKVILKNKLENQLSIKKNTVDPTLSNTYTKIDSLSNALGTAKNINKSENQVFQDQDASEQLLSFKKDSLPIYKNSDSTVLGDKNNIEKFNLKNFSIGIQAIPSYPISLNNSNPINKTLSGVKQNTLVNFGYGAQLRFNFNEKLALRVGFNKQQLSTKLKGLSIGDLSSFNITSNSDSTWQSSDSLEVRQKIKYHEIPVEMSYLVLDKKIKTSIVGGFSYWYLQQNDISIYNLSQKVGTADTNKILEKNLSINFGVSFKYQLTKRIGINFDPIVKYHLTDLIDNTNYQPLFFSIQTGVFYKF